MTAIPATLQDTLDLFEPSMDRMERIDLLNSFAAQCAGPPDYIAMRPYPERNRVPSCESGAYVWVEPLPAGRFRVHLAVENPQGVTAQALASILRNGLDEADLAGIMAVPEEIIYRIFGNELSMGKQFGLRSMVRMVKEQALRTSGG